MQPEIKYSIEIKEEFPALLHYKLCVCPCCSVPLSLSWAVKITMASFISKQQDQGGQPLERKESCRAII